ncbi:major facilitator superfamily transporter [Colletotrichum abscissum]|uniref:Major facilitator superfamily transporter n=1 Tax=Colletotrichum abscissum TaxID=1671311 RepID=A0A9P9WZE0_9PEZI|nr:major facilitator superfamily transporter [Colletotrichum abscissum]
MDGHRHPRRLPHEFEGAIFMSVGRNVLNRKPIEGLTDAVKDLDPQTIVNTGATALRDVLPVEYNTPTIEQGISGIVIQFNEG